MTVSRRVTITGGVVFLAFAGAYFYLADNLPPGGPFDQVGTQFFPKLLAAVLGGLSILLILATFPAHADEASRAQGDRSAFFGTLSVAFLSVALWKAIGFATTPLLMAGIMVVNGARSPGLVAGVAIGGSLLLYVVFFHLFALPLPLGLLE